MRGLYIDNVESEYPPAHLTLEEAFALADEAHWGGSPFDSEEPKVRKTNSELVSELMDSLPAYWRYYSLGIRPKSRLVKVMLKSGITKWIDIKQHGSWISPRDGFMVSSPEKTGMSRFEIATWIKRETVNAITAKRKVSLDHIEDIHQYFAPASVLTSRGVVDGVYDDDYETFLDVPELSRAVRDSYLRYIAKEYGLEYIPSGIRTNVAYQHNGSSGCLSMDINEIWDELDAYRAFSPDPTKT